MKSGRAKVDVRCEAIRRRPRTLKEAATWGREFGERDAMLREFLDEFYMADEQARADMLAPEPLLEEGDERANAYYAAVAEHLSLRSNLMPPQWVRSPERFLHIPFFPAGLESLKAQLIIESPPAFRRRLIFVEKDPLYRPRRGAKEESIIERRARAGRGTGKAAKGRRKP